MLGASVRVSELLMRASQIRSQRPRGGKLYSFHAPETECIGKGKASAPYEFGVKVLIVTTNAGAPRGQYVLHAKALPGPPMMVTPCESSSRIRSSRAARSNAPMSTRDTADTMRKTRAASSSRGRSAASSAPSSANYAAAPQSSP